MQKEFTENLSKLHQVISKPMADLAELNVNTLTHLAKNTNMFDEITQTKRPEDLLSTQMKIANAACLEMTKYTQKAMEIGMNAMSDASKVWTDVLRQTTTKASDFVKQGQGAAGNKEKERNKD